MRVPILESFSFPSVSSKQSSSMYVQHDFSMSTNIIWYIVQAAVIGIPVAAVTSDQPRIAIPVIQVIIFFTCMATLLFMFVPKIVSHRKKEGKKNNGRGTFTQQYLEKLRLENADMNQFSSKKLAHGHHSGLAIRKFEPRLITSMGPAEMMTKEEHLDDNNKKVAFVRGRHLFAKNVESS